MRERIIVEIAESTVNLPSTDADVEMIPSADTTSPASAPAESLQHSFDDSKGHDNVIVSYIDVFGKVSLDLRLICVEISDIPTQVFGGLLPTHTTLSRLRFQRR